MYKNVKRKRKLISTSRAPKERDQRDGERSSEAEQTENVVCEVRDGRVVKFGVSERCELDGTLRAVALRVCEQPSVRARLQQLHVLCTHRTVAHQIVHLQHLRGGRGLHLSLTETASSSMGTSLCQLGQAEEGLGLSEGHCLCFLLVLQLVVVLS